VETKEKVRWTVARHVCAVDQCMVDGRVPSTHGQNQMSDFTGGNEERKTESLEGESGQLRTEFLPLIFANQR
jgi:hypothetical protein